MIGGVMPRGTVVGNSCGFEGRVMPDGSVVNNGDMNGRILPDGKFLRNDGTIGGGVVSSNVAMAPGCRSLGFVNVDGDMFTVKGEKTGCQAATHEVLDEQKVVLGRVLNSGAVIGNEGRVIGITDMAGFVVDKKGKRFACMDPDYLALSDGRNVEGFAMPEHAAIDRDGRTVGWVMPDASVKSSKSVAVGKVLGNGRVVDMTGQNVARGISGFERPVRTGRAAHHGRANRQRRFRTDRVFENG